MYQKVKLQKLSRLQFAEIMLFHKSELVHQFTVTTSGFFTFLTGSDQYAKEKLESSLEALTAYYMDRGYIKMKVVDTKG